MNSNYRLIRGGYWSTNPEYVSSATRNWSFTTAMNNDLSFRLTVTTQSPCKALRGGSWYNFHAGARADARNRGLVVDRDDDVGFRLTFE